MQVFEEGFRLDVPRPRVWEFLNDYARVAPCVPGCEEVVARDADHLTARLRVKVGPVATTQQLDLTVTERVPPERLASVGRGEDPGLASRVTVRCVVELREADGGGATDVRCRVELQLSGRLATLGEAVMRAKSQQMVRTFAERLAAAIGAGAGGPAAGRPRCVRTGRCSSSSGTWWV